jgi:hypothetical protein
LHSLYYYSDTIRDFNRADAFLRSIRLVLHPAELSTTNTILRSFFYAYSSTNKDISPYGCRITVLPLSGMLNCISPFISGSFFSVLGDVYFSTHNEVPYTHSMINTSNICFFFFASRYYLTCTTFNISFFFSQYRELCSHILRLKHRVSYSDMLSFLFFSTISTCIVPAMHETTAESLICDYKIHAE